MSHLEGKGNVLLPAGQVEGVASGPYPLVYRHWQLSNSSHLTNKLSSTGRLDPDGLGRPQRDIGPPQTEEGGADQLHRRRSGTSVGLSHKWLLFLPRGLEQRTPEQASPVWGCPQ